MRQVSIVAISTMLLGSLASSASADPSLATLGNLNADPVEVVKAMEHYLGNASTDVVYKSLKQLYTDENMPFIIQKAVGREIAAKPSGFGIQSKGLKDGVPLNSNNDLIKQFPIHQLACYMQKGTMLNRRGDSKAGAAKCSGGAGNCLGRTIGRVLPSIDTLMKVHAGSVNMKKVIEYYRTAQSKVAYKKGTQAFIQKDLNSAQRYFAQAVALRPHRKAYQNVLKHTQRRLSE